MGEHSACCETRPPRFPWQRNISYKNKRLDFTNTHTFVFLGLLFRNAEGVNRYGTGEWLRVVTVVEVWGGLLTDHFRLAFLSRFVTVEPTGHFCVVRVSRYTLPRSFNAFMPFVHFQGQYYPRIEKEKS